MAKKKPNLPLLLIQVMPTAPEQPGRLTQCWTAQGLKVWIENNTGTELTVIVEPRSVSGTSVFVDDRRKTKPQEKRDEHEDHVDAPAVENIADYCDDHIKPRMNNVEF